MSKISYCFLCASDTSESSNSSLPDVSAINSYWNAAKSHDPEVKPKEASKGKKKSKGN